MFFIFSNDWKIFLRIIIVCDTWKLYEIHISLPWPGVFLEHIHTCLFICMLSRVSLVLSRQSWVAVRDLWPTKHKAFVTYLFTENIHREHPPFLQALPTKGHSTALSYKNESSPLGKHDTHLAWTVHFHIFSLLLPHFFLGSQRYVLFISGYPLAPRMVTGMQKGLRWHCLHLSSFKPCFLFWNRLVKSMGSGVALPEFAAGSSMQSCAALELP